MGNKIKKYRYAYKAKQNPLQKKERWAITFLLSGIICAIIALVLVIVYLILQYGFKIELMEHAIPLNIDTGLFIFLLILTLIILCYGFSFGTGKLIAHPINKILYSLNQLALGNYKTRLNFKGPFSSIRAVENLTDSFNKMAQELEHTETLSNDFINNFSHEFKTPIMSIEGFAKLIKKGKITHEQEIEYLNIIEEESTRLSNLAVSVMNMMKIENQTILSNLTKFNLSEQIRKCILMLEPKWTKKNINLQIDFDEYYIWAEEELLKHVWINLIDNAIKYTPENGTVSINIQKNNDELEISIANTGTEITEEQQKHIFNKFYQLDESHASEGFGMGLAIVKKVATLHNGKVTVSSKNNTNIFTVTLPA